MGRVKQTTGAKAVDRQAAQSAQVAQAASDFPLTIALVVDTAGNEGNGTSNSALQYARELSRQGHVVRLVGIGSPEYPVAQRHVPLVSWIAAKQQMQFAQPDAEVFRKAFQGADVVHVYLPFAYGRAAVRTAHEMGIPATAGFHLQPENVLYSAGPLRYVPGASAFLYWLFNRMLYRHIRHIHTPSHMIAAQLRAHGYRQRLHVISNGYAPRFTPKQQREPGSPLSSAVQDRRLGATCEREGSCDVDSGGCVEPSRQGHRIFDLRYRSVAAGTATYGGGIAAGPLVDWLP
jgi:glycosyltransferase involved in cell wall biosynthesis